MRAFVALVLALASFTLHYDLERRLDRLRVFDQYNVVYQADPNERIDAMSHGWGSSGRNLAHPNLSAFTSPFVRGVAAVAARAGLTDDEAALRRAIGLLIVPAAAGATAALLFALFLRLGMSLVLASLFTVLAAVSFSAVVFGSIPDHFALSVPVIVAAYHLHLSAAGPRPRWWQWFIVMFVAAGITITNLAIIAILLLGAMWSAGRRRVSSALRVCALAGVVLVGTLASSFVLNRVIHRPDLSAGQSKAWATTFINGDVFARLVRFPVVIANTVAPARIATAGPTASYRSDDRYQFRFTFEEGAGPAGPVGLLSLALVVAGGVLSFRRGAFRTIGMASVAVILFNWILHSAWGDETFLYSQHWFVSMLILMALAVVWMERRWRFTPLVVGGFVAAVAVSSYRLVGVMLDLLRAHPG